MGTTNKMLVIAAIIILIALSIGIASSAAKTAKENKRTEEIASGGGGFNPRPYTDAVWMDCYNNAQSDTGNYSAMMKMPDENIRAIFLDWDKRYKTKKENEARTLGKAVKYAYSGYLVNPFNRAIAMAFHQRLVDLGLE